MLLKPLTDEERIELSQGRWENARHTIETVEMTRAEAADYLLASVGINQGIGLMAVVSIGWCGSSVLMLGLRKLCRPTELDIVPLPPISMPVTEIFGQLRH